MSSKKPSISIILPVYNGSEYLETTLNSIINQSFKDFEVLCIDDSSTDNSFDILKEFATRDERIKLFQKTNGGNAVKSIIFGLPYATGNYMFYCSHDDLMSEDLLENVYQKAIKTKADAVIPNMVWYKENKSNKEGIFGEKDKEISGREAFELSLNWKIHGFSLRKMSLVKKLGYKDFAMNSDEYTTREFYLNCNKVVFSGGEFYYRQDNLNALTKKITPKTFECINTDIALIRLIIKNKLNNKFLKKLIKRSIGSLLEFYLILYTTENELSTEDKTKILSDLKNAWIEIKKIIKEQKLYKIWFLYIIKGVVKKLDNL